MVTISAPTQPFFWWSFFPFTSGGGGWGAGSTGFIPRCCSLSHLTLCGFDRLDGGGDGGGSDVGDDNADDYPGRSPATTSSPYSCLLSLPPRPGPASSHYLLARVLPPPTTSSSGYYPTASPSGYYPLRPGTTLLPLRPGTTSPHYVRALPPPTTYSSGSCLLPLRPCLLPRRLFPPGSTKQRSAVFSR